MKILHICNDFLGSKVHKRLYERLSDFNINQTVFSPVRSSTLTEYKDTSEDINCLYEVVFSDVLKLWHTYVFELKQKFLTNEIMSKVNLENVTCMHATTLFSDGALAYTLSRKNQMPYIVTVRSTDVTSFFRFRPDLLPLGRSILLQAKSVVFVSNSVKQRLFSKKIFQEIQAEIEGKQITLPNGVDDFWLSHAVEKPKRKAINSTWRISYIGTFLKRKKIDKLILAIRSLRLKGINIELSIIGGGGNYSRKVKELIERNQNFIHYKGVIRDKEIVLKQFENTDIFAMPSVKETFGLVYVEALLQGIPVLYTEGEGIDGLYEDNVGEKVSKPCVKEIAAGIERIIMNYNRYDFDIGKLKQQHDWDRLAHLHMQLYC